MISMIFFLVAGYLIGSIPFGILVSKTLGLGDIRKSGSGNIGATNMLRVGGWQPALATLILDFAKGFLPVMLIVAMGKADIALVTGLVIVLGHCFPFCLKFKGGKGVATAFGIVAALAPWLALLTALIWVCVFALWRYSSLAAIVAFTLLPVWVAITIQGYFMPFFFTLLSFLLLCRHRDNIRRLRAGEESKITHTKK